MAENISLNDSKIYELALDDKHKIQERRDDINKYYISLFTILVTVISFGDKVCGSSFDLDNEKVKLLSLASSFLGLLLSISWILALKRIYNYLKGIDKLLIELEKKYNTSYIKYISDYLEQINSPGRITKQEMYVPYAFLLIFASSITYLIKYGFF